MDEAWSEKRVFLRALEIPPLERKTYLDTACPTPEARARIEALLAHAAADQGLKGRGRRDGGAPAPGASGALGAGSPLRVDEFEFIRELGRGGMGVVYLARDSALGRLTAVKVLAPHLVDSEQALERFRQEGRAVAALNHPGIVPVYRAACSDGHHYIAMEYVEGETLHDRIRAARPPAGDTTPTGELPGIFRDLDMVRETARIIAAVAEALDHAHRNGVVHRDVKPSNVIVDGEGQPHLTDFGIAKIDGGAALTTPGDIAGTVHYMSPEQAEEAPETIDHRSDVWSLGVVLYEMLALRRPFEGLSQQKIIHAIQNDEPPDLRSTNGIVPIDLATICHKALEKRPQNRFQTAAHMAADLRAFLAGDPILARPPSAVRRVRRWAKRHRSGLAVASMIGAASLTAVAAIVVVLARGQHLCPFEIPGGDGEQVSLHRMTNDGYEIGPLVAEGTLPLRVSLPAGVYRVVVVGDDGGFVETTVSLLDPGKTRRLAIAPPAERGVDTAGMVFVPGGICTTGVEGRDDPNGPRRVRLAPFFIDRAEVSNGEYLKYVEATGAAAPSWWDDVGVDAVPMDRPVVGITWEEAEAYARWIGKRLPTAAEWECAMRAPDERLVPWGDAAVQWPATTLESVQRAASGDHSAAIDEYLAHTMPVDSRPDLATASGILHAATNVTEWTATLLTGNTTVVVNKGAAWSGDPILFDLARMQTFPLETVAEHDRMVPAKSMKIGFRCARSAAP